MVDKSAEDSHILSLIRYGSVSNMRKLGTLVEYLDRDLTSQEIKEILAFFIKEYGARDHWGSHPEG